MRRLFHRGVRLARNVLLDLRFGSFLGGRAKATSFAHLGANDSNNSDYGSMDQIFRGRIKADDVLVDVGCGRGRVINWWLSRGLRNQIFGLELDSEMAETVSHRLRRWQNVKILAGSALETLPADATLIYMFNPFNQELMTKFGDLILQRCRHKARLRIIYFAPVHVDVFEVDPRWNVQRIELNMAGQVVFSERHRWFAIIRLA